MFRKREDGLIVDPTDGRPVAVPIDSFVTALGIESQSDTVILRLYQKAWPSHGGLVPTDRVHQFVLSAPRAAELAHQLLAYAAQVEKESGQQNQ